MTHDVLFTVDSDDRAAAGMTISGAAETIRFVTEVPSILLKLIGSYCTMNVVVP